MIGKFLESRVPGPSTHHDVAVDRLGVQLDDEGLGKDSGGLDAKLGQPVGMFDRRTFVVVVVAVVGLFRRHLRLELLEQERRDVDFRLLLLHLKFFLTLLQIEKLSPDEKSTMV